MLVYRSVISSPFDILFVDASELGQLLHPRDFTNGISRVVWPDFNIPGQEASRKGEPKTAGPQKLRISPTGLEK